ncbi:MULTISPECIES: protein-glutamate O-methyltransferase CheR [unclassified Leptolyngbya]|uniref:CheR family methyltransferase n=1 Tax=unclassified Leptolyngbya TaxID=2650499 RepID=UPI001683CD3A|nr:MULTISPECIES: protein-glutamate O-methyltransferase CheR [unclassified Leptolyngbya]MBD1913226.1 protein-glutamate O-methyltransferase CheR [Leptolyngbya sp. FACHB-8]MBD2153384.1 protein-glutamate O-methyltransferase CheR [Leptolyngbya sp. FACHB-16]
MFVPNHSENSYLYDTEPSGGKRFQNPDEASLEFETLLDYLKNSRACDLTHYKRSTLMRRFRHRMHRIYIDTYENYLQCLQSHPEEHLALLNDVLINFTAFFRDRNAWIYLATEIIPKIIDCKPSDEPIRIWSAGCATGAEIYSLLILLAENLGVEFCQQRIQCYATDADPDALQQAQSGIYNSLDTIGLPPNLLEKYFKPTGQDSVFSPELRFSPDLARLVTFERHDLMRDNPLPAIDLLICRNVLMYFTPEAQNFILTRFHSVLNPTGFLFLGQTEMVLHQRQLFRSVSLKQKIYARGLEPDLER